MQTNFWKIDYRKAHSFAFLFTFDEQQKSNFECKQGIKGGKSPRQVLLEHGNLRNTPSSHCANFLYVMCNLMTTLRNILILLILVTSNLAN
jgi:hypothetical protein